MKNDRTAQGQHVMGDSDSDRSPSTEEKIIGSKLEHEVSHFDVSADPDGHLSDAERAAIDRSLLWKLDLRLIPWLCLLYLTSFLDRTNIVGETLPRICEYCRTMSTDKLDIGQRQDRWSRQGSQTQELSIRGGAHDLFRVLLHLRTRNQRPTKASAAAHLHSGHNGALGYRHDADGIMQELLRPHGGALVPRPR